MLKPKTKVDEEVKEKLVMKNFEQSQKNPREDGEIGGTEQEEHDRDEGGQAHGIPCQAQ